MKKSLAFFLYFSRMKRFATLLILVGIFAFSAQGAEMPVDVFVFEQAQVEQEPAETFFAVHVEVVTLEAIHAEHKFKTPYSTVQQAKSNKPKTQETRAGPSSAKSATANQPTEKTHNEKQSGNRIRWLRW